MKEYCLKQVCSGCAHTLVVWHILSLSPAELASRGKQPKMELAYTTSGLYDLPDLLPASWADLVERYMLTHSFCIL